MLKIILIMTLGLSVSVANANFAKILVIKGKASKLLPGKMKAQTIKKGESLPEYTSIVTYDKSFLRVQFKDKSVINLGANSKMVIAQKKNNDGTVINFLKGVMRSQVDKEDNSNGRNKMLIKTRTAVMGIRGTKFIASYNPVNKNTALVTVEGNVAIAKIDPKTAKDKVKNSMPDEKLLEKKLASKENVIEVKPGEFSGTTEETGEAFKTVKIAPAQFKALAESVDAEIKEGEVYKETEEVELKEGSVKSGGFVDLSTGFYVPPTEDAEFDTKKGVFVASNDIGKVDKSGNYAAPRGTKLDPLRGFIAKDNKSKVASNDLNKNLKKKYDKVKAFNKDKKEDEKPSWFRKLLPKNHLVKFYTSYHMEENDLDVLATNGPGPLPARRKSEIKSDIGAKYGFGLIQEWGKYFSTSFNVNFFRYELRHNPANDDNLSRSKGYVGEGNIQLGFHYQFNPRMNLSLHLGQVESYEPQYRTNALGPNNDEFRFEDSSTESIELEWLHYVYRTSKWDIGYLVSYSEIHLDNQEDNYGMDLEIKNPHRYRIGVKATTSLSKSLKLNPYVIAQFDYQKINVREYFGNYEAVIKQRRRGLDFGAELVWDY